MSTLEFLLIGISLVGVLLNVVGLPGNLVPVVVALGYFLFGGQHVMPLGWFLAVLGIFLSGEIMDQLSAIFGAKIFGATKAGMLGSFLGSVVGALVGSALLPIVGTVLGVFLGCFVFAVAFELLFSGKSLLGSLSAGLGSVVGKMVAVAYKYAVGFALVAVLVVRLLKT